MDENKNLARHRVNSEIDLGERIMVIGCGGSGKSTLSRSLGELLNLPVVHLDRLYWRDGWRSVDDEEFDALLSEALSQGRWIIDGNFNRTIAMRLNRCDTVIYLDYARIVCMAGVIKRVLAYYGRTRPDMGGECPERFDFEFLKWVWRFNAKFKKEYYWLMSSAKASGKKVYVLKKRREAQWMLARLKSAAHNRV